MSGIPSLPAFENDLRDLRADSLRVIASLAGLIGSIWLVWEICPATGGQVPPLEAWVGSGALVLSATLGCVLRERLLRVASVLFALGIIGAISCAVITFQSPSLAYLMTVAIIYGSVLLDERGVFVMAALGSAASVTIGINRLQLPFFSVDVVLPVVIIGLVAVASWLHTHNLYTTLTWALYGYQRARQNEGVARERQAELRRALKALDEATHRLERGNYMLTWARDQAEEAQRLKQQFAQTVSHELRTPLNLVVGFAELMADSPEYYGEPLPAPYLRDLSIIHRSACHLQSLVNDVLDLARVEAAQMSLLPQKTDPASLVREAVETARSLVESRGLTLLTEVEPDLPPIWLDPTRIRQVLFNLLNNAARFTERGSVTLSAHSEEAEVVFAVADTGVGIAPDDLPRVFEEFWQVDGSRRRRHEGAGLGLAICKRFVELHGGRIWAESRMGQGSSFFFSLPVVRRDLAESTGLLRIPPTATSSGGGAEALADAPLLLAVTRSPAAATLISRYVHGFHTVVVQDLEQAQQAASRLLPQGVIIDTAHQGLDPQALQQLAQVWALPRVPIIACPLPGEEPLLQQLNVDGYLLKPISRQGLWDTLRRFGEEVDRVLVIDDDRDFVRLMERLLEGPVRRYEVASAYSGQEGLAMIDREQPDLVLLDLVLPDMHGFQVIDRMRANPLWRHLPIVIVSAQDEIDTVGAVSGTMLITQASGLFPAEVVRWTRHVLDSAGRVGG